MYNSCESDFQQCIDEALTERRHLCDEQSDKSDKTDSKEGQEEPTPSR